MGSETVLTSKACGPIYGQITQYERFRRFSRPSRPARRKSVERSSREPEEPLHTRISMPCWARDSEG